MPKLPGLSFALGFLLLASASARGQEPDASLAQAISQNRARDYYSALLTLSDAIRQLDAKPNATVLARAYAQRAVAYEGIEQPERARAAAMLALKADSAIAVDASNTTQGVAALFDRLRHPPADPESAARSEEAAGRFKDAFLDYLTAYQSLPEPPPRQDDERIRTRIIGIVPRLNTRLVLPEEALDHAKRADDVVNAAKLLGGSPDSAQQGVVVELRAAIRLAPWWAEATFKLAAALQKTQRFDDALMNLALYKLADPAGYAKNLERAEPAPTPAPTPRVPAPKAEPPVAAAPPPVVVPALINVYWPSSGRAMGVPKQKIFCDGEHIADLSKDHVLALTALPGTHTIKFRDHDVTAQFEAGKEYYVRIHIEGFPAHFAPHVEPDNDKSAAEIKEKNMAANDPKNTQSNECRAAAPPAKSK